VTVTDAIGFGYAQGEEGERADGKKTVKEKNFQIGTCILEWGE